MVTVILVSKMRNFLSHLLIYVKNYPNAHAKVKTWIFNLEVPGNRFEFGFISNDFWSFAIWNIRIQVSFTEFKNPEIPRIQSRYWFETFVAKWWQWCWSGDGDKWETHLVSNIRHQHRCYLAKSLWWWRFTVIRTFYVTIIRHQKRCTIVTFNVIKTSFEKP